MFNIKPAFILLSFLAAGLTSGCGSSSSEQVKEQSKLKLRIDVAKDVNPDEHKHAAPIMVRIYELKTGDAFEQADFYSLQDNAKKVLAEDLLAHDEFILRPGATKTLKRKSNKATTVIGVIADYRTLSRSVWRATYTLPEAPDVTWYSVATFSPKSELVIHINKNDINITEME